MNEAVALNRLETKQLVEKNNVITMRADTKTGPTKDIHALMKELGNQGGGIPFYAVYPGKGGRPITFDGPVGMQQILDVLQQAGPSRAGVAEAQPKGASREL